MMMMETKNRTQIIVLVGGILGGIVTGTIITAHHFGKMGGRAFPEFIFCATAGALIASIIKYLVDKRRGINTTTSKLTLAVSLCVIVGLLSGAGIGYHYFQSNVIIGVKLPGENPAKLIYPNDVINTIFDDSEKINNTAGFLIKCYKPLTENQIQVLRDSGVRLLQTSEIATVYHSLIEENKVEEVEKLDFVEYIYPYKTRIYTANKSKTFEEIATKDKIIVGIEAGPVAIECFNKSYLIETSDYIIDGTVEKVDEKADMEKGIYSYVYLTVDGYFKGKPLLVKEKVADMLQINVSIRAPYNFTPYEGKKVRIYLRKWSEGDIRIFCGHYGIEEILEHTKEVPTMMDIPHLNLTPQPGEYFTYHGNKSKILLNDSRLKYCFLELKDICPPDAANVGDLGIVITGTIKNEYDRDYYICMAAHAFNSEGEQIGGSIDRGPVCGVIAPYVKSGQTRDFELHLKYKEDIERIVLSVGCVSEIPPP